MADPDFGVDGFARAVIVLPTTKRLCPVLVQFAGGHLAPFGPFALAYFVATSVAGPAIQLTPQSTVSALIRPSAWEGRSRNFPPTRMPRAQWG